MERSDLAKILAPWLLVPLTALDWWIAWGRLPERVVMRYRSHGQPAAWATREQAMLFDVEVLGVVLVLSTLVLFLAALSESEKVGKLLAGFAVVDVLLFLALNGTLWIVQVP